MGLLSRDAILRAKDGKTADVQVPQWGGTVRVRGWTVAERNEYTKRLEKKEDTLLLGAWLVATLAVDDAGGPLFTAADVEALATRDAQALDLVTDAIYKLNTVTKKEIEAAAKN